MKQQILSVLPGDHPWQNTIFCYDTVDSTNNIAKAMAKDGAPEGTIIIAQTQTAGRGRLGRSFHAPQGLGIYFSLILRPNCHPEQLMHLTCAVAVAMCNAVESCTGFRPQVKWINDLIANRKKLGGILTELSVNSQTGLVDWAVVGIGINCGHKTEDFPSELQSIATSLLQATGKCITPAELAPHMITALHTMRKDLFSKQQTMMNTYRKDCITLGRQVILLRGEEAKPGKALDVDDQGGLIMDFGDGKPYAVQSGEVSVRDFCGYA